MASRMLQPLARQLLVASLAYGCACMCGGTKGSGIEASEQRTVEVFDELSVGGVYDVQLAIGPETTVTIVADDNLLPLIKTKVANGRLRVRSEGSMRPEARPTIRVTTPSLSHIEATGASRVDAKGLAGETLEVESSGASHVTVEGVVERAEFAASGASSVDAKDLRATDVQAEVSGSSNLDLTSTGDLFVEASGASTVTYAGNPTQIRQDSSGAATIHAR